MELVKDELHSYQSNTTLYPFKTENKFEYRILYVRGYILNSYGVVNHFFEREIDFNIFGNSLVWLGEDIPVSPPAHLGFNMVPFWITYVYEETPLDTIKSSVYPFMKRDGIFASILDSFGTQIVRIFKKKGKVIEKRDLKYTSGEELDMVADWFNTSRFEGETDIVFRTRLLNFVSSFLSSGTKPAIKAVLKATTGVEPTILELYENTSYWNRNPDDHSIKYVWSSRTNPPTETATKRIARFSGFVNQPGIFYVIYDLDIINQYGISTLKSIINSIKACGIVGYLGYLVDEHFEENDDNWDRQTSVPSGTSATGDWSVVSGEYKYKDDSVSYHDGLSVVNIPGSDDWKDCQITAFVKDTSGIAGQIAGVVLRWDEDTDEFYFFGVSAQDNKAYIYKWFSSAWTKIAEAAVTIDTDAKHHIRVVIKGISALMYIDNELVISNLTDFDDISMGRPGVASIANSASVEAYFDDIVVVI